MKAKKILTVIAIALAILLLPIPSHPKDGGHTTEYTAILYKISDVKRPINPGPNQEYLEGIIVEILGKEVFNSVK